VINPRFLGGFLVRMDPASAHRFDETRVNDEVWPAEPSIFGSRARLSAGLGGFFSRLQCPGRHTYKNFRKFQTTPA